MQQIQRRSIGSHYKDKKIQMQALNADESFSELSKSEYSLNEVINVPEFRQLSKQIKLKNQQQEKLIESFYSNTWKSSNFKFARRQQPQSLYSSQYRKWKGSALVENKDMFKDTYESTLALLNKRQQKDQVNRLIKQSSILSYSQNNPVLQQIYHQYSKSFQNMVSQPYNVPSNLHVQKYTQKDFSQTVKQLQTRRSSQMINNKQKLIELDIQKYYLQKLKQIDEKQRKLEMKAKKQDQLKKTCFVDLVRHPPVINVKSAERKKDQNQQKTLKSNNISQTKTINIPQPQFFPQNQRQVKHQPRYKLNIEQMLKIPYRLFLIFYSQHYNQIVRLCSPQELKRINQYRNEALNRQQAVDKLKKKIAQQGSQFINKLPSQMKEKLFRILYQKDLEEQRYYENHQ